MIFCKKPMPSTSSAMINIEFHTNSKWAKRFGCICRKSTSQDPMSTLLWALHHHQGCGWQWFWIEYSPLPWPTPSIQCGPPSPILSTTAGHNRGSREVDTYRAQPRLHGTEHHWSHYAHTSQGNLPTKDPTLLGGQSRPTTPPGKMAYQGLSSTKVSPSNGGTQCNGNHYLLRGEDWSRWILMATHLFH